MSKSVKSTVFLDDKNLSVKELMFSGDVKTIEENIVSQNNLGIVLAISAVIKNKLHTPTIEEALRELVKKNEFEFCINISSLAYAALDILSIEKYTGNDKQVFDILSKGLSY